MKKFRLLIAAVLTFALALGGCGKPEKDPSGGDDNPPNGGDNLIIDIGDKNSPTYSFTENGVLTQVRRTKQDTINRLSATDDFDRSFDYIDGYKTDKDRYVGLFYFAWLGQHGREMGGEYDISKLIDERPNDLWNTGGTVNSPVGAYHFWGEPLYGYYNSLDPWVLRKQVELFTMAGIDFICFDVTNGTDYISVVTEMLKVLQEYYDQGWNVPKFMFYTNSNSASVVRELYAGRKQTVSTNPLEVDGIYKKGYYKDLWFCPDGKRPKIVAITEPTSTNNETPGARPCDYVLSADASVVPDDPEYSLSSPARKREINKECLEFFDVWESQWPNKTKYENGLPWMDWTTTEGSPDEGHKGDQTVYGKNGETVVNVSVAQHNVIPFSMAIRRPEKYGDVTWGRGFSKTAGADHSDNAIDSGINFEEEWQVAIDKDVKYAFVTGWNEWVALKSVNSGYGGVFFVDTTNREYSRDIEMMKGGYADNFYLQLMRNARKYKGKSGTLAAAEGKTVDIKNGLSQWSDVKAVYDAFGGNFNRNFKNFSGREMLTDNSMRNDITSVRVTDDADNIYFLVECEEDIVAAPETSNFMNLFISVDGQSKDEAWYGYQYVINRKSSYTGECSVEKFGENDFGDVTYTVKAKAAFTLKGKYMQYKISKSSINVSGDFTIRFKVADNVTDVTDMQSYYITGDCAPVGRLNYTYKGGASGTRASQAK